jgi:hypothetical protein
MHGVGHRWWLRPEIGLPLWLGDSFKYFPGLAIYTDFDPNVLRMLECVVLMFAKMLVIIPVRNPIPRGRAIRVLRCDRVYIPIKMECFEGFINAQGAFKSSEILPGSMKSKGCVN